MCIYPERSDRSRYSGGLSDCELISDPMIQSPVPSRSQTACVFAPGLMSTRTSISRSCTWCMMRKIIWLLTSSPKLLDTALTHFPLLTVNRWKVVVGLVSSRYLSSVDMQEQHSALPDSKGQYMSAPPSHRFSSRQHTLYREPTKVF